MSSNRKSNEVFSPEGVHPGLQQHLDKIAEMSGNTPQPVPVELQQQQVDSFAAMMARDFGVQVVNQSVPLPSKGLYYPTSHPLYGVEYVDLKSMTSREEDLLTSQSLMKKGTIVTELIKSCLVDKRVNPLDLLVGDRNALMVAIRVTGYGAKYSAKVKCSDCGEESPRDFDLAQLVVKTPTISPVVEGTNEFEFVFSNGIPVRFRFMTGRDEEEMHQIDQRQRKLEVGKKDASVSSFLQRVIVSVNGVTDKAKLANFASQCPADMSSSLRKYINDNMPGIVMKQESECKLCNYVEEVSIPIGVQFLWPNAE